MATSSRRTLTRLFMMWNRFFFYFKWSKKSLCFKAAGGKVQYGRLHFQASPNRVSIFSFFVSKGEISEKSIKISPMEKTKIFAHAWLDDRFAFSAGRLLRNEPVELFVVFFLVLLFKFFLLFFVVVFVLLVLFQLLFLVGFFALDVVGNVVMGF